MRYCGNLGKTQEGQMRKIPLVDFASARISLCPKAGGEHDDQNLPELNIDDFEAPYDLIVEFYRGLGWNSETQELDPRNIKIHFETWGELCNGFRHRQEGRCSFSLDELWS